MTEMVEVESRELSGLALDWAVDGIVSESHMEVRQHKSGNGEIAFFHDGVPVMDGPCEYSTDWNRAGPLIKQYNISLSPPTSPVHINGGPNSGWKQSGYWGATTFDLGVNGRRAIALHKTDPIIAAMCCLVEFKLGRKVMIPAALLPKGGE